MDSDQWVVQNKISFSCLTLRIGLRIGGKVNSHSMGGTRSEILIRKVDAKLPGKIVFGSRLCLTLRVGCCERCDHRQFGFLEKWPFTRVDEILQDCFGGVTFNQEA